MIAKAFIDTNVLIYAAAGKVDFPQKYEMAWDIIGRGEFGLSGQVLAEFYTNVTKKPAIPLSPEQADGWMVRLSGAPVIPVDSGLVVRAIAISRLFRISYWDAAVIAAAERLEATTLFTEDLNHGQVYGAVQVINPFLPEFLRQ